MLYKSTRVVWFDSLNQLNEYIRLTKGTVSALSCSPYSNPVSTGYDYVVAIDGYHPEAVTDAETK